MKINICKDPALTDYPTLRIRARNWELYIWWQGYRPHAMYLGKDLL